jgi:hypothetical protein
VEHADKHAALQLPSTVELLQLEQPPAVFTRQAVELAVAVAVGLAVVVAVAVDVTVEVAVLVAVGVAVSVRVAVAVGVALAVAVPVDVAVGVPVEVAVAVGVAVSVGLETCGPTSQWPHSTLADAPRASTIASANEMARMTARNVPLPIASRRNYRKRPVERKFNRVADLHGLPASLLFLMRIARGRGYRHAVLHAQMTAEGFVSI